MAPTGRRPWTGAIENTGRTSINLNRLSYLFESTLRNVWRRRRRNLFVVCVTAGAVASVVLFHSFIDKIFWGVRESAIHSQTGHLQITHPAFDRKRNVDPLGVLIADPQRIVDAVVGLPGVELVTTRLEFSGLVGLGGNSTVYAGMGVEPDKEPLLSSFDQIIAGRDLGMEDKTGAILGEGLAKSIDARPGDSLLLMTRSFVSGINAVDVTVQGVSRSDSSDYDRLSLKIPMARAQELLGSGSVSRIIVLLLETERTAAVKAAVERVLAERGWQFAVTDWQTLNPGYQKIVGLYLRIFGFFSVMLSVVVVLSLSNTLIMGFMERVRDLSIMRTIGASPRFLGGLFALEALWLGLLGGLLGVGLAASIIVTVTHGFGGLAMPPPPGSEVSFRLRLELDPGVMGLAIAAASIVSLLASITPIWRVLRLNVVSGLRR